MDAEVDDVRDISWRGNFMVSLYLVAKPFHVGVDVDGLACLCTVLRFVAASQGDMAFH
jgi:hypothetical protein